MGLMVRSQTPIGCQEQFYLPDVLVYSTCLVYNSLCPSGMPFAYQHTWLLSRLSSLQLYCSHDECTHSAASTEFLNLPDVLVTNHIRCTSEV